MRTLSIQDSKDDGRLAEAAQESYNTQQPGNKMVDEIGNESVANSKINCVEK